MNAYEFIIKMKDMASSNLQKIAGSLGMASNSANGFERDMKKAERTSGSLGGAMGKLKSVLAGVFAATAISAFTNKVVDARAEYEKFNAVLSNTFQSDKVGAAALNMLTDFATKTPFQLNDLTGSFVKLVNRGFNPTMVEMTKLGDLASSQGKGFDQLTEAVLDAQTGEFERLKEFGINASKQGDKVKLSFKSVPKEVANIDAAIRNALMSYGEMTGVAGSMNVISQTLGGKISNLGDQWNSFLVAVGGESGGIFTGVISGVSVALAFLTDNLGNISMYFSMLWGIVSPLIFAFKDWILTSMGITGVSDAMNTFKNVMAGVLTVIDFLVAGAMSPLGQGILTLVGCYMLFNAELFIFNALMAVNPMTWIIIGIIVLIGLIGMVTKYTSGWGESWTATVNGAKLSWQFFMETIQAKWGMVTNTLMIGIDKIKVAFIQFKESMGMGDSATNQKMIAEINADVEARKKAMVDGFKKAKLTGDAAKNEFGKVGITVDTAGMKKDFEGLKSKFSGSFGKKDTGTSAYDQYILDQKSKNLQGGGKGAGKDKDKAKADNIVSGGNKMTSITINIEKLQDDTKIYVASVEQGLNSLGDKVQEIILRAVNSVNQMQTN